MGINVFNGNSEKEKILMGQKCWEIVEQDTLFSIGMFIMQSCCSQGSHQLSGWQQHHHNNDVTLLNIVLAGVIAAGLRDSSCIPSTVVVALFLGAIAAQQSSSEDHQTSCCPTKVEGRAQLSLLSLHN